MIRVGRRVGNKNPEYPGFTPIVVMMKSHSKWSSLSPYYSTINGYIMENIWQFSKLYPDLPASAQKYSAYDNFRIWEWSNEKHLDNDIITDKYWNWRQAGFNNKYAVRYPPGIHNMHKCAFSVFVNLDGSTERLNYIQSRKKVYLPTYVESIKSLPQFKELQQRLVKGENILIIETDGPHQESLNYYVDKYGVNNNFIEKGTVVANTSNLRILLNDDKHPFCHGYCLAAALLNIDRALLVDYQEIKYNLPKPFIDQKVTVFYLSNPHEYVITDIDDDTLFIRYFYMRRINSYVKVIIRDGRW